MNFKSATDELARCVTQEDLAEALGVSRNTISRARLDRGTSSYRSPPEGWRGAVATLARERAEELLELARQLEAEDSAG